MIFEIMHRIVFEYVQIEVLKLCLNGAAVKIANVGDQPRDAQDRHDRGAGVIIVNINNLCFFVSSSILIIVK